MVFVFERERSKVSGQSAQGCDLPHPAFLTSAFFLSPSNAHALQLEIFLLQLSMYHTSTFAKLLHSLSPRIEPLKSYPQRIYFSQTAFHPHPLPHCPWRLKTPHDNGVAMWRTYE
jgi:hypothetical protein